MSPEEVDTGKSTSSNVARHWRVARLFIGILMCIETVLLFFTCFSFWILFVMFLGGSAKYLVGGSAASDANAVAGLRIIWLIALAPILWPLLMTIGTINIFLRKRPLLVIFCCAISIIIGLWVLLTTYGYYSLDPGNLGKSNPSTMIFVLVIVFIVIQLAGLVVAFRMKKKEM